MADKFGEELQITHLLFAEDILVFCNYSRNQLAYLSWILIWFEAISSLKINVKKSLILPVRNLENLDELAFELGCRTGALPSTYHGLPPGMKRNSLQIWDGVGERFRKKLALWKRQYISKGERLTLIKSTLSNMPIYTVFVPDSKEGKV